MSFLRAYDLSPTMRKTLGKLKLEDILKIAHKYSSKKSMKDKWRLRSQHGLEETKTQELNAKHGILGSRLEHKNNITGEHGEIQIQSVVW